VKVAKFTLKKVYQARIIEELVEDVQREREERR